MTESDIAVRLEGHEKEIRYLRERLAKVEQQSEEMRDLTRSIDRLTDKMETMIVEQKEQKDKLRLIEGEPADKWKTVKKTALTSIVSTIAAALAVLIILALAKSFT